MPIVTLRLVPIEDGVKWKNGYIEIKVDNDHFNFYDNLVEVIRHNQKESQELIDSFNEE